MDQNLDGFYNPYVKSPGGVWVPNTPPPARPFKLSRQQRRALERRASKQFKQPVRVGIVEQEQPR